MLAYVLKFSEAESNVGTNKDATDPRIGTAHAVLLNNSEGASCLQQLIFLYCHVGGEVALHHRRRGSTK